MPSNWSDTVNDLSLAARKVTDAIRHVIRDEELNDALAQRHAHALVVEPLTGVSTAEAYTALREALASNVRLSTWRGDPRAERPILEEDFRSHLGRVVEYLDSSRPWPVPLFRPLDPTVEWNPYTDWRVLGAVHLATSRIEDRLHNHLLPMVGPASAPQVRVAVFELRSGHRVALVGRWWADQPDVAAVLIREPDALAADVMAELTSEGHFEPGEYEVLG